ncbi:MAG TPA: TolC family protein [Blastocatellia bacterium]|nr:TolC family protein [Blastocatellia bacterium]
MALRFESRLSDLQLRADSRAAAFETGGRRRAGAQELSCRSRGAGAEAGIDLARTAYLPRTDLLWQENRASRNNIFGLLLPQSVVPGISGPVLGTKSVDSVWGSAAGVLFSWEPFDFGLRKANTDLARALTHQADASVEVTRLDVATSAADAFLAVLAAEQTVRAAEANVERMQVFARAVHVLVDNQLRAGGDASRADAELAAARIQLVQAQQTAEINRATLAETLGLAGTVVAVEPGPLLTLPAAMDAPVANLESHPLALAQTAAVETARARERVLDRSFFPRFNLQTAFSGRGTGALLNGDRDDSKGLLPDTPNWASGISISFPVFDIIGIGARRRAEASNELAEKARFDQTMQALKAQDARVHALIEGARRIADNTPVQLNAAREAETRAPALATTLNWRTSPKSPKPSAFSLKPR